MELSPELEALRQELAADYAAHPEKLRTPELRPPSPSMRSLDRIVRLLEQRRGAEAVEEMQRFVRLCRVARGETVVDFPIRPRRPISPPAGLPPAA